MLSDSELRLALEPVRGFLVGVAVNQNTVLAAWLRAESLPTHGAPWYAAKEALSEGLGFDHAVGRAKQAMRARDEGSPSSIRPAPRRGMVAPTAPFRGTMDWFPKRFGPGDIDGVGARRLLGTPNLDPTTVLAREMAQNAWDARGGSSSIRFTFNLRQLEGSALETLRNHVFTGPGTGLGVNRLLAQRSVWCLEVSDRGTVGLNGPTRNDLAIEPGVDRNFVDLVFNIGAPRDTHLGGGTYGFGKTISYVISSVGTVLIWSRSLGPGGYEDRLIGSAMGDAFNGNGRRFTGRHWWGHVVDDGTRVEPVIGSGASALAASVFQDRFGSVETGTSFLILDPDLTGDTPEEKVEALKSAVLENLWPKLMNREAGRSAMDIAVFLNGRPVEMPKPEEDPRWTRYAACLRAVRAAQSVGSTSTGFNDPFVKVFPIASQRPKRLLGHLALTRAPLEFGQDAEHHVALMRHQAELVVKKQEFRALEVPGFHWMGVFKPVEDVDDAFAEAEPPAHDDWIPAGVKDKAKASLVRVAMARIKAAVDSFLKPGGIEPGDGALSSSVAHVGDLLADMVGSANGPGPSRRTANNGAKSRTKHGSRTGLEILDVEYARNRASGWDVTTLKLRVKWAGNTDERIELQLRVGTDGASHKDDEAVRVDGWGTAPEGPWTPGSLRPETSGIWYFRYQNQPGLAIDVMPRGEGV